MNVNFKSFFTENKKRVIITAVSALLFVLIAIFMLVLFDDFYCTSYNVPRLENGVLDGAAGVDKTKPMRNVYLVGDWEFFYGDWIVTDNVDRESDGFISLPGSWAGRELNGKRLPKEGFASYRIKVKNISAEEVMAIFVEDYDGAYKVFVDGKLYTEYGVSSKNYSEVINNGKIYSEMDVSPESLSEIVVEISANKHGGFNVPLGFYFHNATTIKEPSLVFLNEMVYSMAKAMALVCVIFIFIVITVMLKWYKSFSFVILVVVCSLQLFCSIEMERFWVTDGQRVSVGGFYSLVFAGVSILSAVACMTGMTKGWIRKTKANCIVIYTFIFLLPFIFWACYGTKLTPIPLALAFLLYVFLIWEASSANSAEGGVYTALLFFIGLINAYPYCYFGGMAHFLSRGKTSVLFCIVMACLFTIFMILARKRQTAAKRIDEVERKMEREKQIALRQQIKPNFITKIIGGINSAYRISTREGDELLTKFSGHLRLHVSANNKELLPFEEDMKNEYHYFELESYGLEGKPDMLVDIEFGDFLVPILFLQPIIENAIIHGYDSQKEDFCIIVSSKLSGHNVVICVEDNGKGFDTKNIQKKQGLTNFVSRAKMILKAETNIFSSVGNGTRIEIKFPYKRTNNDSYGVRQYESFNRR